MSEIAREGHGDLERLKKRLLTAKDLADKLNVSEKTIYTQE
jgi:DNA-binding CsgD family transcriptional regulator